MSDAVRRTPKEAQRVGIALDAMGGDHAPREIVKGAVLAAQELDGVRIHLVGRPDAIQRELHSNAWHGGGIEVTPAEEVIGMADSPVEALRRKRGSSIERAVRLLRGGQARAVVSAGNTGACVAAATILLGHLPLVKRAGIAVTFYAGNRPLVMIDVGANIAARPEQLIQYGIMASIYARAILGLENPRVGLLSIGEENEKGNRLVKETHALFRRTQLNFVGNIEGVEIFRGACDVLVCDGFTGNVVLKASEGLAECLLDLFKTAVDESLAEILAEEARGAESGETVGLARAASTARGSGVTVVPRHIADAVPERLEAVLRRSLAQLRARLDYSEYGGAPLLGVDGLVIIAHGRSDARAIASAIRMAYRMAQTGINERITSEIAAFAGQGVS